MLLQVMTPSKENPTVSLPPELYGTEVKILAFPTAVSDKEDSERKKRRAELDAIFDSMPIDLSNYKFNREEANDYD